MAKATKTKTTTEPLAGLEGSGAAERQSEVSIQIAERTARITELAEHRKAIVLAHQSTLAALQGLGR